MRSVDAAGFCLTSWSGATSVGANWAAGSGDVGHLDGVGHRRPAASSETLRLRRSSTVERGQKARLMKEDQEASTATICNFSMFLSDTLSADMARTAALRVPYGLASERGPHLTRGDSALNQISSVPRCM
jgi:hypothetical protein